MSMKIKAGILQFRPLIGERDHNINTIDGLLQGLGDVDLLVFPELSNSGYNFTSREQAYQVSEEINESKFVDFLIVKANELNTAIVCGINERENGKLYNTAVLVDKSGVIGKYRKTHLYVNEKDFFELGDLGFPVFELNGFKIGICICFDYLFPEIWRMQVEDGADLICHPSNLISENAYKVIPALSLINRTYILTANRFGAEDDLRFCGKSFITDPFGDVIEMAAPDQEEIIIQELDLDLSRNKMVTSRNHALHDRRPSIYK